MGKVSLACSVAIVAGLVTPASSQPARTHGLSLDGMRLMAGVVEPLDGGTAPVAGVDLSLGTLVAPWLDFTFGTRYWSADIDRRAFGSSVAGDIRDLSFHTDLHYHAFRAADVRPYLVAGLAAHSVRADIPEDNSLEDALSGLSMGADVGVGVASTRPGIGFRAEVRRQFTEDVGNWMFTVGAGWWPTSKATKFPSTTIQPAQVPQTWVPATTPVPVMPATKPADPEKSQLAAALTELLEENRTYRAKLDSLLRASAAPSTAPESDPPPVSAPVNVTPSASETVQPVTVDRRREFEQALWRLAEITGNPQAARQTSDGYLFALDQSLLFPSGGSILKVEALEQLRRIAVLLYRFPELTVRVDGHTDSTGSAAHNQTLSLERAQAVRAEFVRLGVPLARIDAAGFGATLPMADNATAEGRARNRRVEIRLFFEPSSSQVR